MTQIQHLFVHVCGPHEKQNNILMPLCHMPRSGAWREPIGSRRAGVIFASFTLDHVELARVILQSHPGVFLVDLRCFPAPEELHFGRRVNFSMK